MKELKKYLELFGTSCSIISFYLVLKLNDESFIFFIIMVITAIPSIISYRMRREKTPTQMSKPSIKARMVNFIKSAAKAFKRELFSISNLIKLIVIIVPIILISLLYNHLHKNNLVSDYLKIFMSKGKKEIINIETKGKYLTGFSVLSYDTKESVLKKILDDDTGLYDEMILPILFHTIVGISDDCRKKIIEFSLSNIPKNATKLRSLFTKEYIPEHLRSNFQATLIKKLKNSPNSTHLQLLVESLCEIGDSSSIPILLKFLEDNADKEIALKIISALGDFGDKNVVKVLVYHFKTSNDRALKDCAAKSLVKIDNNEAVSSLISIMNESKGAERVYVAESLGNIGIDTAVESLLGMLEDPNPKILIAAIKALGNFDKEEIVRVLKALFENPPEFLDENYKKMIRLEIIRSLGNIDGRKSTKEFLQFIESQKNIKMQDEHAKLAIAEALGDSRDPKAIPFLIQMLNDPDFPLSKEDWVKKRTLNRLILRAIGKIKVIKDLPKLGILLEHCDGEFKENVAMMFGNIGKSDINVYRSLETLYNHEKNFRRKCIYLQTLIYLNPSLELLKILIERHLPHPLARAYGLKESILQTVKHAAGKIGFDGNEINFYNIWEMLNWWRKKTDSE